MLSMEKRIFKTIIKHRMIKPGFKGIIVGLSGGADSVALLHFLAGSGLPLLAVHINHGLRGEESEADEDFCRDFCKSLDIPIKVFNVDVGEIARLHKLSIEEAGRMVRYDTFKKVMEEKGFDKIATGHHKNDAAETVLMQILRGTGRIRGIPPVRDNIIRPLIDVAREEIERYCQRHKLSYCVDHTNALTDYTRNKIRLETIPLLAGQYNPNLVDTLARLADISQGEDDFLDKFTPKFPPMQLPIKEMGQFHLALQRRAVRHALKPLDNINHNHIDSVLSLLYMDNGKEISLPGNHVARRSYDKIIVRKREVVEDFVISLPREEDVYIIQANCWFYLGSKPKAREGDFLAAVPLDGAKLGDTAIEVRRRRPGDKIFIEGVGTKKVKDWLIDKKIPKEERDGLVFVAAGEDVIAILGKFQSDKFMPEDKNAIYLQVWKRDEFRF